MKIKQQCHLTQGAEIMNISIKIVLCLSLVMLCLACVPKKVENKKLTNGLLERYCSTDIVERVQRSKNIETERFDVLASFSGSHTDLDCEVAIIEYYSRDVSSNDSLEFLAAYIYSLGLYWQSLSGQAQSKLEEITLNVDMSDPVIVISVANALRSARLDLRKELTEKFQPSLATEQHANDDPSMHWLVYLWSLGDDNAIESIHEKLAQIEDMSALRTYLYFIGNIDQYVSVEDRTNFLKRYFDDKRKYTDLNRTSQTIGQLAQSIALYLD